MESPGQKEGLSKTGFESVFDPQTNGGIGHIGRKDDICFCCIATSNEPSDRCAFALPNAGRQEPDIPPPFKSERGTLL